MENQIDPSSGLLTWQILIVVLLVTAIVIIFKIYKRISKYLSLKDELLKTQIGSKD